MDLFRNRLVKAMSVRMKTSKELADESGISQSSIAQYRNGRFVPAQKNLNRIAKALDVPIPWLMGYGADKFPEDGEKNVSYFVSIPILGRIACGVPLLAVQNQDGMAAAPPEIPADFALRCVGDSMEDAHIFNGDLVFIRQQPTVENGEIAAVLIDTEATLKRVFRSGSSLQLVPCNVKYPPMVYQGEDLERVKILGKAVGITSGHVG